MMKYRIVRLKGEGQYRVQWRFGPFRGYVKYRHHGFSYAEKHSTKESAQASINELLRQHRDTGEKFGWQPETGGWVR
jgi:hypothetical protein